MRNKALSILTLGALLLCAPLLAQEPAPEPESLDPPTPSEAAAEVEEGVAEAESEVQEGLAEAEEGLEETGEAIEDTAEELDPELPRTAGPLPLLALLGLGSVGAAFGVNIVRRRK